jgi:hypothetical protein
MTSASRARAYVYHGEWVADCPRGCGNVEFLYLPTRPGGPKVAQKPVFDCSYCNLRDVPVEWPDDMPGIMTVLARRPVPHTRNWYPAGHETAVRFNVPHGQSVDDLRAENVENGVEP